MIRYTLAAFALLAATPAFAQTDAPPPPASDAQTGNLTGKLAGPDGADLGAITVTPAPNGVILRVEARGLTPGWHAMHFHEKASCADEKFASAGGHVHSMTPVTHGLLNADANDAGDLPNLFANADGSATAEVYSTFVSAREGGKLPALMDADGSSLVIHAMADDYTSQPIGGAGVRVACAALQ